MATTTPPSARRRWLFVAAAGVALAGFATWQVHSRLNRGLRAPPVIDETGLDPSVAAVLQDARAKVAESPDSADAWGRLGMLLHVHMFVEEAHACYAEAERRAPEDARWPYLQANLELSHIPEQALPNLRRAAELAGDKPDIVRLRLADLLLQMDRRAEAEQLYKALLDVDPGQARARLGLARLAALRNDSPRALKHLERCLADPHTRKAALTLRAEVLARGGDTFEADRNLSQAQRAPADLAWPDPWATEVAKLDRSEKHRRQHFDKLVDSGHAAAAISDLHELTREFPGSSANWVSLGFALLKVGKPVEAEPALKRAVELDGQSARAWLYLGAAQYQQKDRLAAVASFRRAVAVKPDYAEAYFNLGIALKEQGDRTGAIEAATAAVRCQPQLGAAHLLLGELLTQAGRSDDAAGHLRQALEITPGDRRAKELLDGLTKGK